MNRLSSLWGAVVSKVIKKRSKIRQYWKKLMDSPHNKLSRGSMQICRIIPWARGENWRHSDRKQRKPATKG